MKCAVVETKLNVFHDSKTYTLVVDYCQNMEVPVFNKEQQYALTVTPLLVCTHVE